MDLDGKNGPHEESATASRRLKRKLTPFLCQEMLYEYAIGTLDPIRRVDIDEYLPTDKSSQEALEAVRRGLDYAEHLSRAELSTDLLKRLSDAENATSLVRRYMDWEEWPEAIRWSISAVAISVLIAGIVTVIPWQRLPNFSKKNPGTVVLAEIPESKPPEDTPAAEVPDADVTANEDTETSGDEHEIPGEVAAAPPLSKSVQPPPAPTAAPAKTVPPVIVAQTEPPKPAAAASAPIETPSETAAGTGETSAPKEAKPKGFVYRAFMNLPNVEEVTPDIVQALTDFGAEKAGEVPLGWRRGNGSYFHFTMPSANEEKALEMLRGYGPVRISKDPHPRVMPEGQVRFILWVEPAGGSSN